MKLHIVLWLCVFLAVPAGAQNGAQNGAQRIDGPTVKVGDVWMFNKINARLNFLEDISVNTVKAIDAKGITMVSTAIDGSGPTTVLRTPEFNLVSGEAPGFYMRTLPFYPNFSFPLWIGKTWKGKVKFQSSKTPMTEMGAKLDARVVGWESVTVPAGNFMALKIELKGEYQGMTTDINWPLWGDVFETGWYVPEVRNFVRYEYRDTANGSTYNHEVQELVRYWLVP